MGRSAALGALVVGSVASLAANVAVAEPTMIGRVIAAWPSFALTASYELLTRQVRHVAAEQDVPGQRPRQPQPPRPAQLASGGPAQGLRVVAHSGAERSGQRASGELRRQAWHWALAHQDQDGILPSGEAIARAHGRHERWGRLVKNAGLAGAFDTQNAQLAGLVGNEGSGGGPGLRPGLDQPPPQRYRTGQPGLTPPDWQSVRGMTAHLAATISGAAKERRNG